VIAVDDSSSEDIKIWHDFVDNAVISGNVTKGNITTVAGGSVYIPRTNKVGGTLTGATKLVTDNAATLDVSNYDYIELLFTDNGSVTALSGGYTGQAVTLVSFNGNANFVDGAGITLAGGTNLTLGTNDSVTLVRRLNGTWIETGRSDN